MDRCPHLRQSLQSDDLCKNLARQGARQETLNLLMLSVPEIPCEVCTLFVLPILSDGESFRRRLAHRMEVVCHLGALDL